MEVVKYTSFTRVIIILLLSPRFYLNRKKWNSQYYALFFFSMFCTNFPLKIVHFVSNLLANYLIFYNDRRWRIPTMRERITFSRLALGDFCTECDYGNPLQLRINFLHRLHFSQTVFSVELLNSIQKTFNDTWRISPHYKKDSKWNQENSDSIYWPG